MKCLLWLTSNCGYLGEIVSSLKNNNHQIIVLLALDGVFLLDKGCNESSILQELGTEVYAIQEHVEERGLFDGKQKEGWKLSENKSAR